MNTIFTHHVSYNFYSVCIQNFKTKGLSVRYAERKRKLFDFYTFFLSGTRKMVNMAVQWGGKEHHKTSGVNELRKLRDIVFILVTSQRLGWARLRGQIRDVNKSINLWFELSAFSL